MDLNFKNLPVGDLPYDDIQLCKRMMLRLYENLPFLPELPLIDANDNIFNRTFNGIDCIKIKDGKILLPDAENDKFVLTLMKLDKIYNCETLSDFDDFVNDAPYMQIYEAMLEKFKPKYTVLHLFGPFTFANSVFNRNAGLLLTDRNYRKFIIQLITIKALWYIYKIKSISPETKPIIMFNENLLYKFGTLKRTNESITNDSISSLFAKIFSKLKKAGAVIGVQSFEKCNWQLVLDANYVNIISFGAYNNPNNLNIIADSVNNFLARGGIINWGIVPVSNENIIKSLNIDYLFSKFQTTLEDLASEGVSADLLYKNSTVSIDGNLSKIPILFAEKALILAHQLGNKIPASSASRD